ncbi:MAG: tyrosine recombinase XerD [Clostridia bacterium]|nr:tyrosine recombinase XerD [Clostridia bacterium]
MEAYLEEFMEYLTEEQGKAKNTREAYRRDLLEFQRRLAEKEIIGLEKATNTDVVGYLLDLKNTGKSAATVNRKVASLRAFYRFMVEKGYVKENPTFRIKSPRIERKELEYLTVEEMDKLLSLPDGSLRGVRDRAILEVLYATGIRVSEITEANLEDINLRMGFVTCKGEHGKARIVPMGRPAKAALEEYVYDARPKLLRKDQEKGKEERALFVNYAGDRITRQGLWKIIKEYAKKAGIESNITPQTLRNSFAVHMIQNGADIKSLQELLGHEDPSATQVFLSVTKSRIKDVYDNTHPRA